MKDRYFYDRGLSARTRKETVFADKSLETILMFQGMEEEREAQPTSVSEVFSAGYLARHNPDEAQKIQKQYWGIPDETRDAFDYLPDDEK